MYKLTEQYLNCDNQYFLQKYVLYHNMLIHDIKTSFKVF